MTAASDEPSAVPDPLRDPVELPDGYRTACRRLGVDGDPKRLLVAGYTLALCCWLLGLATLSLGSGPVGVAAGLTALVVAVAAALAVRYGVPLAARAKRGRALGAAPSLVTALVLGVTLWPTAERAAAFAASAGDGRLAARLAAHRRRAAGTPESGLGAFAAAWRDRFPALAEAVTHVERAAATPASERPAVLGAARRRVLDGTRDEMARFAADLRGPTTGLYAFGVLLPLAFVSLLPAAAAAGVPVTAGVLVGVYGVALPAGLAVASAWLLARRPLAFPPAPVPRTHPEVPSRPTNAVAAAAVAAVGGWIVGAALRPGWGGSFAALGFGPGVGLFVHYRPVVAVREHVERVEAALPDALTAIGRRVDRGTAVETALTEAASVTTDPLASLLVATVDRQRTLGTDLESAFRGDHGTLATVPSPRLRRVATLLSAAAAVGPPAGASITRMGEHLEELRRVERETERDLAQVTGTLSNTAALFGPLVGGATVALAGSMRAGGPIETVAVGVLGPVVGWYCLVLAALLTALSTGLYRGFDRALVGSRVGLALCSATATFLAALVATRLLV
ncbi:type II secretion system F family protein [Haloarcula litorea]|uniref:type II secretion system F family protein n=1 Tax=Haloarcula litorea TaxID=3032579 RepID=UPI0023E8C300|nr:type II secretion system protein [Halomicroarcula sp. GDY20]